MFIIVAFQCKYETLISSDWKRVVVVRCVSLDRQTGGALVTAQAVMNDRPVAANNSGSSTAFHPLN